MPSELTWTGSKCLTCEEEEYWDGLEICNKFTLEKEKQQELHAQILRSLLCPVTYELRVY